MKRKLARLTSEENAAWEAYFNWYWENRKDNRPSRCDKYAWDMLCNEFPRLKKYDGCLPRKKVKKTLALRRGLG